MPLSTTTSKHLLLLLNFIFAVLALILIGFGIFVLVSASSNQVDHGENVAGALIITVGVIILIVAVFGCLAAIHESRPRLIIYIISLVVLILIQLSMNGMASLGSKDGLSGSVSLGFDRLWEIEQKTPGALAYYEDWLHCCGVNNTDDYRRIQHEIPKTCCKGHDCRLPENFYTEGCEEKFLDYLADKMVTFTVVTWILIIVEIASAVLGWMLYSSLKNHSRRSNVGWM